LGRDREFHKPRLWRGRNWARQLQAEPDTKVTLVVTFDLSAAKPGRYYLGIRGEEQGQEQAAYYYPVLISGT
jgi:hypothetical protein